MKISLVKTLLVSAVAMSVSNAALAMNASTMTIKNYTQSKLFIKVFDAKQNTVAEQNILTNDQTPPSNWVSSNWIWQNDTFDSIDVFYVTATGQTLNCGTIQSSPVTCGETVSRTVYVKDCSSNGLNYTFFDS